MRRRKKAANLQKYILGLVTGFVFILLGTGYAAWTDGLGIISEVKTGSFDMRFDEAQACQLSIVDAQDKELAFLEVEVKLQGEDAKQLDIDFRQGIPLDKLLEGNMLRICFLLKNTEEGESALPLLKKADFTEEASELHMEAQESYLHYDSQVYLLEQSLYEVDLCFEQYPFTEEKEGKLYTGFYLRLDEASREKLLHLPQHFSISEEELELLTREGEAGEDEGISVRYRCLIDLHLDQSGAGAL